MKQELLIAIVLLATGSAIWIWQNDSGETSGANQESLFPADVRPSQTNLPHAVHSVASDQFQERKIPTFQQNRFGNRGQQLVHQAAWPSDGNSESSTVSAAAHYIEQQNALPKVIKTDCPPEFRIENTDPGSENLLRQVAASINTGQPIQSTFKMRSLLFDVELEAEGRLWQIGQGSRKSRMELAFSGQTSQRNLLQICDGRFVFQVKQFGGQQKIEFVDLQRLQNNESHLATASLPGSWVGRGSLADLFVHLADAFKFNPPVPSKNEVGETTYSIRGHWKPDRLYQMLDGVVEKNKLEPVIQLSKMPPQLPHAANVILKKMTPDSDRFVPVQIEFYRFEGESSQKLSLMVEVAFERFEFVSTLDGRLFELQSSDGEAVDMTDIYNHRIDTLVGDQGRVADVMPVLDGQFPGSTTTTLQ